MKSGIKWPSVENTEITSMTRDSHNPWRQSKLQQTFKLKEPKIKFSNPKAPDLGSPWTTMKGSK